MHHNHQVCIVIIMHAPEPSGDEVQQEEEGFVFLCTLKADASMYLVPGRPLDSTV